MREFPQEKENLASSARELRRLGLVQELKLTNQEKADLVAFLRQL